MPLATMMSSSTKRRRMVHPLRSMSRIDVAHETDTAHASRAAQASDRRARAATPRWRCPPSRIAQRGERRGKARSATGGCSTSMTTDHGAVGLIGQDLQQHGMRHTAVDDVPGVPASLGGTERGRNLGQHAMLLEILTDQAY